MIDFFRLNYFRYDVLNKYTIKDFVYILFVNPKLYPHCFKALLYPPRFKTIPRKA